ncbi:MAG TPA: LemA family protein [Candidatus Omnitrophota bacterium]|nr:LemA family protein [Candidatus Omnitrophota bacterium]
MIGWIILALLVAAGLWLAGAYNHLVALKNEVLNGWKQIDVQLKRRYDLIPNLVETVKGIMKFEQDTFTRVIEARNKAVSVQGIADKAVQENILSGALRQLFALVENYPQLKSNENVARLQEELVSTENRIGFARQFYNDIATKFNIAIQSFPSNLIAGMFNFKTAELFEVSDEAQKQAPKVDLNLK